VAFLNTHESVLEKASSDKKTDQHSVVCISRKDAGDNCVFYNLWSGTFEEYVHGKDFPYYDKPPTRSYEYTPYLKINGKWFTLDWWWWYAMRYEGMKSQDVLDKIVSGRTPVDEIHERYIRKT
jgi:hypothetical protein